MVLQLRRPRRDGAPPRLSREVQRLRRGETQRLSTRARTEGIYRNIVLDLDRDRLLDIAEAALVVANGLEKLATKPTVQPQTLANFASVLRSGLPPPGGAAR